MLCVTTRRGSQALIDLPVPCYSRLTLLTISELGLCTLLTLFCEKVPGRFLLGIWYGSVDALWASFPSIFVVAVYYGRIFDQLALNGISLYMGSLLTFWDSISMAGFRPTPLRQIFDLLCGALVGICKVPFGGISEPLLTNCKCLNQCTNEIKSDVY